MIVAEVGEKAKLTGCARKGRTILYLRPVLYRTRVQTRSYQFRDFG